MVLKTPACVNALYKAKGVIQLPERWYINSIYYYHHISPPLQWYGRAKHESSVLSVYWGLQKQAFSKPSKGFLPSQMSSVFQELSTFDLIKVLWNLWLHSVSHTGRQHLLCCLGGFRGKRISSYSTINLSLCNGSLQTCFSSEAVTSLRGSWKRRDRILVHYCYWSHALQLSCPWTFPFHYPVPPSLLHCLPTARIYPTTAFLL